MPSCVRWALGTAVLLIFDSLYLLLSSPTALVPLAVYAWAAIGLWRGSPWGGYGPSLFGVAGAFASAVIFASNGKQQWILILSILMGLVTAWLLFRGGHELNKGPLNQGAASFWTVLALGVVAGITALSGPYRLFTIPTDSMAETILLGDQIVMAPPANAGPSRGDIVIYHYPANETTIFNKRVVGIPGDRIRVVNKQLILNGTAAKEPYVVHKDNYVDSFRDNFPSEAKVKLDPQAVDMLKNHVQNGEIVVPPGMYFVMGDNRDRSLDSRYAGFVPSANVLGTAWFVFESVEPETRWYNGMRWNRLFLALQ